jgi:hypothetical protein
MLGGSKARVFKALKELDIVRSIDRNYIAWLEIFICNLLYELDSHLFVALHFQGGKVDGRTHNNWSRGESVGDRGLFPRYELGKQPHNN